MWLVRSIYLVLVGLLVGLAIGAPIGFLVHPRTSTNTSTSSINTSSVPAELLDKCLKIYPLLEKEIAFTREEVLFNKTIILPASKCKEFVIDVDRYGLLVFWWKHAPPITIIVTNTMRYYRLEIPYNPGMMEIRPYVMPVEPLTYTVKICNHAKVPAAMKLQIKLKY